MAVTYQRRRGWIRTLFEKAEENHISFLDQIKRERANAVEQSLAGTIQSISGNGISTAFVGESAASAEQALSAIEDLYEDALTDLEGRDIDEPTDAQIKTTMLALTPRRVTAVYNDYSAMRP